MLSAWNPDGPARRLVPFVAPGAASVLLTPLPGPSKPTLTVLAAVLALLSIAGTALTCARPPAWWRPAPVYLVFLVVGLLRDAHGGGSSGYAPLALLPVLWLGLYGTRKELQGALVLLAATFIIPVLLLGGPAYPVSSWRLALLMTLTGLVVGVTVQNLTTELRRRVTDQQAIARATGSSPATARDAICLAACEVSGADFAYLLEPDAARRTLTSTAQHGLDVPVRLAIGQEASASVDVLLSGRPFHIQDSRHHPSVSRRIVEQTGVVGALLYPVARGGQPVAVLSLGFAQPLRTVPQRLEQTLDILAAEAALIIERADLYEQLGQAALTDGLTGAANRRAWDTAVADPRHQHATGQGTVVALLDLDHFKAYNDLLGHLAGDELLRSCVAAWQHDLRDTDVLARWGGEEFAVLLPECTPKTAAPVLERLRRSVPGGCTVSIGATHVGAGQDLTGRVKAADMALYQAKQQGRDRLCWHQEPTDSAVGQPVSGPGRQGHRSAGTSAAS